MCEIPHLRPRREERSAGQQGVSIPGTDPTFTKTSPVRASFFFLFLFYLPSIAEDAARSAHNSANKSTAMADGQDSLRGRSPNSQDARARVKKNPSVVRAVLQQAARAVSHISSRSKQCVTTGTGGRTERWGSSGARKGCGGVVEGAGGGSEEEEALMGGRRGGGGGTRHRLLSVPLVHPGQSASAEPKLAGQSAEGCSAHRAVANAKLFLDLFERTLASQKGNSAPTWMIVSTATESEPSEAAGRPSVTPT